MLRALRAPFGLFRSCGVIDERFARLDCTNRGPFGRKLGWILLERLTDLLAARIVDDQIDASERTVFLQDVNGAVVSEHRHGEPRQRPESLLVVERRGQERAGMRKEALILLHPALLGDVHEDSDSAADAAVGIEQRRRVLHQRDMAAVRAFHVDDDAADFDRLAGGLVHRPVLKGHASAILERQRWNRDERRLVE